MKAATGGSPQLVVEPTATEATAQNEILGIEIKDLLQSFIHFTGKETSLKSERRLIKSSIDMKISRSCRYKLSVPVMFWTTVFVLILARGVSCGRDDNIRFSQSQKYDQGVDAQGRFITPSIQETYNVMQFLRELIQRQQQRAKEQPQADGNGDDFSGNQIDWRKIPLPILYQIRAILSEQGSKEDKRGSYMSLCHFKICNLG